MSSKIMQRLACESCGATTGRIEGNMYFCDFCSSQYIINGERPRPSRSYVHTSTTYIDTANNPYFIDGGVSIRGPGLSAVWLD